MAYAKSEQAAKAKAKELELALCGAKVSEPPPIGDDGLTRGEWIAALWGQLRLCQELTQADQRVNALSAMSQAYKMVREDLAVLENGVGSTDDPAELSDAELDKKIIKLSKVRDGTA